MKKVAFFALIVLCLLMATTGFTCDESNGQIVYAPASYNVIPGTGGSFVVTRLIIRNISQDSSITLTGLDLYSPEGIFVRDLLGQDEPYEIEPVLDPLSSVTILLSPALYGSELPLYNYGDEPDKRPCFIVKWKSHKKVCAPMIYSIGITFGAGGVTSETRTPSTVIGELGKHDNKNKH